MRAELGVDDDLGFAGFWLARKRLPDWHCRRVCGSVAFCDTGLSLCWGFV